jgi:hypothetical protein
MANAVTAADFEKLPPGRYRFDRWKWRGQVSTAIGSFGVSLQMLGKDDTNPPDIQMIRHASELVTYTQNNAEYIHDIVYGHYLFVSKQPDWMEECGVALNLSRDGVLEYLGDHRSLVVSRHLDWDAPYASTIFMVPKWDEEHALRLEFLDGTITSLNECRFRLNGDILSWVQV